MADGGFRPADNLQFCTATDSQVIVGVGVETTGSDAGQLVPMVEQVKERYEIVPAEVLVDGGFAQHDQIEAASAPGLGCTVYAPVPKPKGPQVDRHAPKPSDSAAVAAWRERMGTGEAKLISKERAATAECVHALARGRGLIHLLVRGLAKVKAPDPGNVGGFRRILPVREPLFLGRDSARLRFGIPCSSPAVGR